MSVFPLLEQMDVRSRCYLVEIEVAYHIYRDVSNQWRWRLRSANMRIIAISGEAYHNKQDCLTAINLVKGSSNAPVIED